MSVLRVIAISLAIGALFSCAGPPPNNVIAETISSHFEARGYRVIAIELGEISALGLGEKTYMGTETYIVGVRSIRLETLSDIGPPWNHRTGDVIRAENATIAIRKNSSRKTGWSVGTTLGIPVR